MPTEPPSLRPVPSSVPLARSPHERSSPPSWAARTVLALGAIAASLLAPTPAHAEDLSAIVARARDQVENGSYADALRVLGSLKSKNLPPALAIEAALLETTALLVSQGAEPATNACGKAVLAAGYDPEVARDQSPKVREVCRNAARKVRGDRLKSEGVSFSELAIKDPEVAYEPIRISTTTEKRPPWLKVVARVTSSDLEGSFDLPLVPSDEGPLLGTLDPAWIRPKAKLTINLVPQDKFGDLGAAVRERVLVVPAAEAIVNVGKVPKGAVLKVDGKEVTADEGGSVPVTPGSHDVSLTLSNGASASTEIEPKRGSITRVALSPQVSSSRVLPWIATGTAAALVTAGSVLLVNANARKNQLETAAAQREAGTSLPATDYKDLQSIDSERRTFTQVGVGLLIGGGATAVLATTLWLIPTGGGSRSAPAPAPKAASIVPLVGPGFLGAAGTF